MRWKFCPWCGQSVVDNFKVRREVVRVYSKVGHNERNNLTVILNEDAETYETVEVECMSCYVRWTADLVEKYEDATEKEIIITGEL
jgi:hypothetical protein